ncbi:xylulokinase [Quadrisphaera sp. DSM 44207]|uniref:xylulokinase n=1 Tax=Quadrisphaera sp. DSM 44207 TaxID=1881057 RepID=UPI00088ABE90|nr:xylulokinase [Quadrisphaera sp. DSM 44207]SDQ69478.1 xylulokinase [Quadrisphaera sp. DSM 44207]
MRCVVGIDLGTSSVRVLALAEDGRSLAVRARSYPLSAPHPGWAEQDPATWWEATADCLREVLADDAVRGCEVAAASLSGQMHGTVLVDAAGLPVRPAVAWPDRRTQEVVRRWCERVGAARWHAICGLPPSPGMLGPTLAWLAEHEPRALARAAAVLLPKDAVRARLTGRLGTDPTDASGTLLLDVAARAWSPELTALLGEAAGLLPPVLPTQEVAGEVTAAAAERTGLPAGTPVVTGGSDQSMAALALELEEPGTAAAAISSGGTVLALTHAPVPDPAPGLHVLCHLPGRWLLQGAMLTAGLSLRWLADALAGPGGAGGAGGSGGAGGGADVGALLREAELAGPGAQGLLFLPYLAGERTPHLDPAARGAFLGLALEHSRGHLARAVVEGVAFALVDCLAVLGGAGAAPTRLVASGGGARSALWRQVLADASGLPVLRSPHEEHSVLGAARTAATGAGMRLPPPLRAAERTDPDPALAAWTAERLALFRSAWLAVRGTVHALGAQPAPPGPGTSGPAPPGPSPSGPAPDGAAPPASGARARK